MCRDVNGDGTWGGVVLGAVREVAQGLVQGVVEEVVLGVDTNFGIIMSIKGIVHNFFIFGQDSYFG